jgi:ribonuclease-3
MRQRPRPVKLFSSVYAEIDDAGRGLLAWGMRTRTPRAASESSRVACSHRFKRPALLVAALAHPSSTQPDDAEARRRYQRLEFLGDAVWNLAVSAALAALWPSASEGELTVRRARLVSGPTLAHLARAKGLTARLVLGPGEEATGGREKVSILASVFEAVIGAIYLDGGETLIRRRARDTCRAQLKDDRPIRDAKTTLQELVQWRFRAVPRYRTLRRTGPPHAPGFEVAVVVGGSTIARGRGRSKREAEQAAATEGLSVIRGACDTTSSVGVPSHH